MTRTSHPRPRPAPGAFQPELLVRLRAGYGGADLRADALAGLTVAIVALPLSMAIAIASGTGPERGLYAAIVGGFIVSFLGGSRYQIGGPAGAFIVLVAACVAEIGIAGLLAAVFLSGLMLVAVGALRLGGLIRFIPYPVTLGFTAGIGVIILASQLRDFAGLHLPGPEPTPLIAKLAALWAARSSLNPAAFALALLVVAVILGLRRWRPRWPGMLIALILAAVLRVALDLPVETIGSRFGDLPRLLPAPALPDPGLWGAALPYAFGFALLGAIESLLSAVVADGMAGSRHRPDAELLAQGLANIGAALFGGICVTGTIARTATNLRAGSRGPVSGMIHAVLLLGFLALAAPLAAYVPLAALAGLLAVVAWNMAEPHALALLARASRPEALVAGATFLAVILRDLIEGIGLGLVLSAALVGLRAWRARGGAQMAQPGAQPGAQLASDLAPDLYLRGGQSFVTAPRLSGALEALPARPDLVLDLGAVPFVDASIAQVLAQAALRQAQGGGRLILRGARPELRAALARHGLVPPRLVFAP